MIRNVIVKVTLDCNIACRYCYVRRGREVPDAAREIMSDDTLSALLRAVGEHLRANPSIDRFVLYWHGGEPLRAGARFFERARALQERHLPPGATVVNTIQTNGVLLDDAWARVIRDNGFGVCLSLDGPPEIHDAWRRTLDGRGTHDLVMRGVEVLRRHGIPISVLSVITPEALPHGAAIYRAIRALDCRWMDFMYPFYSAIDNTLDMRIEPARWGDFLVDVFDAWMAEGDPTVTVRLLEDLCMLLLGGRTQMCISGEDCSYVTTVYPSGDVFICDDLLAYGGSLLGNVRRDSLASIQQHPSLVRLARRDVLFGEDCSACKLFGRCKGGCTLFRARSRDDFLGRHFFCDSQRRVVAHIGTYFTALRDAADPARARRRTAAAPPPG